MNRRSFFRSMALVGAAASLSPHIFIPKFEPVKWKVRPGYRVLAINPDWVNAPFEIGFIYANGAYSFRPVPECRRSSFYAELNPDGKTWRINEPIRFDYDNKPIPPCIWRTVDET